jgi:hypothetical protein
VIPHEPESTRQHRESEAQKDDPLDCGATLAFDLSGFWHLVLELAIVCKIRIRFSLWSIEAVAPRKTRQKWGGGGQIGKFRKSVQGKIKGKARLSSKALSAH